MFRDRIAAARDAGAATRPSLTVAEQKICPVTSAKLGSMGDPSRSRSRAARSGPAATACPPKLKAEPAKYLARLDPAAGGRGPQRARVGGHRHRRPQGRLRRGRAGRLRGPRGRPRPALGDRFPVLEGLAPGEKVAAAGAS